VAALAGVVATPGTAAPRGVVGQVEHVDQDGTTLTVMARNLYLGADVGVALDLLPDLGAAAQQMWEQVAVTDFDARVGALADEAARARPAVIGLQEATTWSCRPQPWSAAETVYDFTAGFLAATEAAGVRYVVAEADGGAALNPGYTIPPIPFATRVVDPGTFQPLFGTDEADCGFTIADALLVREDLADDVLAAGTVEMDDRYAVVPIVFEIDRGYAWADVAVAGTTVRFVTVHLESLWDEGAVPTSAVQAGQLVDDLAASPVPTVVLGDFNADPRDPRPPDDPNPAAQPVASAACPAAAETPEADRGACNAYWAMRTAGFEDVGPDATDPRFFTWGTAADLAGPDAERLDEALAAGATSGFTERLDYVFVLGDVDAVDARIVGNRWPRGKDLWECDDPGQVATTEAAAAALVAAGELRRPLEGTGRCFPTDHAGIVATLDVSGGPDGAVEVAPPPDHGGAGIGLLGWLVVILVVVVVVLGLLVWGLVRLARRVVTRSGRA
jgi:hypothetical protein